VAACFTAAVAAGFGVQLLPLLLQLLLLQQQLLLLLAA
jgi:hypothetical protein